MFYPYFVLVECGFILIVCLLWPAPCHATLSPSISCHSVSFALLYRFFMYLVYAPARAGWFQDEEKMNKSLYIQQLKGLKSMHLPGDDKH